MFSLFCMKTRQAAINMKPFRKKSVIARSAEFLFKRNLLLTNSLSSGGFMALGDMIQQEYEYRHHQITERYDWARMKRMFMVGSMLGFLHHFYYHHLDYLLPKADFKTVLKKVACDQFICAPPTTVLFFYGMGILENKNLSQCTDEVINKFPAVYMGDWLFWPPVQAINFYFLPTQYRVFYINGATMVFDIYLSLMKHYDQHEH